MVAFRPLHDVTRPEDLLKLLKQYHDDGLGSIKFKELQVFILVFEAPHYILSNAGLISKDSYANAATDVQVFSLFVIYFPITHTFKTLREQKKIFVIDEKNKPGVPSVLFWRDTSFDSRIDSRLIIVL